jgi:hypothetical protein
MTNSRLRLLTAFLALSATCGCSALDNCPDAQGDAQGNIKIEPKDGTTDLANLTFESAPASGPLTPFPAKTKLWFEHGLGTTPLLVQAFLAFSDEGTNGAGGGSITEVAGNEVAFECYDSKVIVIKNDTCEASFFVRVVATGQSLSDPDKVDCGE